MRCFFTVYFHIILYIRLDRLYLSYNGEIPSLHQLKMQQVQKKVKYTEMNRKNSCMSFMNI